MEYEKKLLEILPVLFIDYGFFDRMYCHSDTDTDPCLVLASIGNNS
jgi:hypothetical protein